MPRYQELVDNQVRLINEAREVLNRADTDSRDLTAEEQQQFDQLHDEADNLKAQADAQHEADQQAAQRVNRQQESERALRELNSPIDLNKFRGSVASAEPLDFSGAPNDRDFSLALNGWFRQQVSDPLPIEESHQDAAALCGINLASPTLHINLSDTFGFKAVRESQFVNALESQTLGSGGALIPEGFVAMLERAALRFGGMLQVADVIRTAEGNALPWPTVNDTTNTGRQLGEGVAVTTLDPVFKQQILNAYKFTSDEVLVSSELLQDSAIDLASLLADILGERLGRIQNQKFTTGTGAATPEGIITGAVQGKLTASATAIAADEIFDLQHSVDPAYRSDPSTGWMLHDSILAVIRKIKGSDNNYLFQPGLQAGVPGTLLGQQFTINQDMASSVAADNKTILYGQLNKYKIRQVRDVTVHRLIERHRENDQDAFLAFVRSDGKLLNAGTNPVKYMQQAP